VIKPPSLIREYTWIWSRDPALNAPDPSDKPPAGSPPDVLKAWDERLADWDRRMEQARDTGQYDGVLKPGERPTRFTIRSIPADLWMYLGGLVSDGSIKRPEWPIWVARLAIRGVHDLAPGEAVDVKLAPDPEFPRLGQIASADVINRFGDLAADIFGELFGRLVKNPSGPSPK
jgi:hypothetical protein